MTEEEARDFNPDARLSPDERVALATMLLTPGFRAFQKLFKAAVDHIGLNLMNTPSDNEKLVIAKHRDWKVAGQVYTILVDLLNREKEALRASMPDNRPVDAGEGLDMGEFTHVDAMDEEGPF